MPFVTSVTPLSAAVPGQAVVVGNLADVPVGSLKLVKVDGRRLCLVHTSSGVHALDNACPHEGYGLTTGELDGELLTCAWHNWKFRVSDGRCVLGEEDVRTHTVDVADDGTLSVTLVEPSPESLRPQLLASLRSGITKDYIGQVSRDVVRLLRADANPGELIWEAVAYGAPRAEFGWGHSIASLTDCLEMTDRYVGDERALPIVQAIAGVAEAGARSSGPAAARPERGDARPTLATSSAGWSRPSNSSPLRRCCAVRSTPAMTSTTIRPWFTDIVSDHLLSYGHGAIYAQKAFQLLDRLGWDRADTVLPYLVPSIVYGTREDKLPYMKLFHRGTAQLDLVGARRRARRRPTRIGRTTAGCSPPCSGPTAPRRRSRRAPRSPRGPGSMACSTP